MPLRNPKNIKDVTKLFATDLLVAGSNQKEWYGAALAGGSVVIYDTLLPKHPGIGLFMSSTSANSGYKYRTESYAITLGGGEKTTFIFRTPAIQTTITRYMGFADSPDHSAPTDGVYGKILDGVLTGQASNNSVVSTTGSNYTLAANTWYRLVIELNDNATLATYTLYADDSDTVLWSDTVAANIPTARNTGHGDTVSSSGTTAVTLGYLDYMDIELKNIRRV